MNPWAIIPVKSLVQSKSRLARVLPAAERASLTHALLTATLSTLCATPAIAQTLVISPDPTVLELAGRYGAVMVRERTPRGLNRAVAQGAEAAIQRGASEILVLPADLPFVSPDDILHLLEATSSVQETGIAAICPDRADAGTNALLLAPPLPFTFQYGHSSFQRHVQEGNDRGLFVVSLRIPGLQFDLDTEEDWHVYQIVRRQLTGQSGGRFELAR